MVSDVEYKYAIGKHIGIYPFEKIQIEGASFDLHASPCAWSITTGQSIVKIDNPKDDIHKQKGTITIPPGHSVIIFTEESLSLDNYYTGACYSKLKFAYQGINHSSSPLKPGYTGRLSVSFHNSSKQDFILQIGDPIIVVMLDRLNNKVASTEGNGRGTRFDLLSEYKINIDSKTRKYLKEYDDRKTVLEKLKKDGSYKEYKKTNNFKIKVIINLILIVAGMWVVTKANPDGAVVKIMCTVNGALILNFLTMIKVLR